MKLWYSFIKELQLAFKSFYFYMELIMAVLILIVVTTVVPENFNDRTEEFIYMDLDSVYEEAMVDAMTEAGELKLVDTVYESKKEEYQVRLIETEDSDVYIVESEADLLALTENEKQIGAKISMKDNALFYDYYLQGYESDKMKNMLTALHTLDLKVMEEKFDSIGTVALAEEVEPLNSREHLLPVLLYMNGSLMGMFIIAGYIFLDKQEGIIKAYAVTASKVWVYLASKIGVLTLTALVTSLIIVIPVMGLDAHYLFLALLLITSSIFVSVIGLIMSSYYTNVMQSFGVLFVLIILLGLPAIAYSIPSWSPIWIRLIPTYPLIQGFKETILENGDMMYVFLASLGFLAGSLILFVFANYRFKKTLTVEG